MGAKLDLDQKKSG